MATAAETVLRAYKELRAVDLYTTTATLSSGLADHGLDILSRMLANWPALGLSLVDEDADIPVDEKYEDPIIFCLAVRLSPSVGVPVSDDLRMAADTGWAILNGAFAPVPDSTFDSAIVDLPSNPRLTVI
jgi:hypothetical protein